METFTHSWEQRLLDRAYKPIENSNTPVEQASGLFSKSEVDKENLERAYCYCTDLTKYHSRTFFLASSLLPNDKRRAVRALYAFCRISDDLVDRSQGDLKSALDSWKERAISDNIKTNDPVAMAWKDTRTLYNIPVGYAEQLIDGVARDLVQTRYETFDQLAEYCYGVAATVGLMVMHIIGFEGKHAIPYAVKLGVSFQLNNILRDVGEDWEAGRLYLPQNELEKFGITESQIAEGKVDNKWRDFMRFQINRNRTLYNESTPGIALLDSDGRFAIIAAAELYRAILEDIEIHDYDVFHRRAYVSNWGKLRRLPGIWWQSREI